MTELEDNLSKFANIIDGDEVLLFERATFLVSVVYYNFRIILHEEKNNEEKISWLSYTVLSVERLTQVSSGI